VWYQPKYDPGTGAVVGAEALVRWRNSDGSLISPGTFIPLFERNGMIRHLDEYVFRAVCMQQVRWQQQGCRIFPISVNLSRASLYFQNVVERYRKIAKEIGIDPAYVPIEITETAALDDKEIRRLADHIYEAGFPLHMDDFGSGYSSFATLNIMHFDTLKLDKSLIDYIGNYSGDRLLEHTIALAKELGMHVTAEGVENREQVVFLQELNCDSIQGFYFSKPLPMEEFSQKIMNVSN
jgi:EAL domain-containing protein (putative c-di-GMP-specific phosphodiesterase class I)